jgi:hypothetical protein
MAFLHHHADRDAASASVYAFRPYTSIALERKMNKILEYFRLGAYPLKTVVDTAKRWVGGGQLGWVPMGSRRRMCNARVVDLGES